MRTRDAVSPEKLRGGFYSPEVLVKLCLNRAQNLLGDRASIRVLEPAAGDGAFIRGLAQHPLASCIEHVEAVELLDTESAKAETALRSSELAGRVLNQNILEWYATSASQNYDVVLANPPYVRFQFISEADKQRAKSLSSQFGVLGSSVSNLWIPVFLLALNSLSEGGAFSVILPTEFLTGVSASRVRSWLLSHTKDLSIDLFKPGSFPTVLQEVLVLSGRRSTSAEKNQRVTFTDHNGGAHSWEHVVSPDVKTWTSYLLTPEQLKAYQFAQDLQPVRIMSSIARFSVSTVTGANGYFCLPTSEIRNFNLDTWALPLLGRSRHAQGLVFTPDDHQELTASDHPSWILSFSADRPGPESIPAALNYIQTGEAQSIHARYKTRIRTPWYRVPIVPAGELLLSKRSNEFPRVISNQAKVITTDTIYRGKMVPGSGISADDLTASFHNSLTLLSAEVEGRSLGGGVLELVPSEVASLLVPVSNEAHKHLPQIDAAYRASKSGYELIENTDMLLSKTISDLTPEVMDHLREARAALLKRRLMRTASSFYGK
ncbi:Eco57I restriction-modification methylase domain-containing protein [Nocardiopsis dassonvillei]|uniref:Eco57I restriction-modification methylase domain-containing protein n=1 Tax=Nocardiopsis dassonvillei TaxID=2014 RepID=UPI00362B8C4D